MCSLVWASVAFQAIGREDSEPSEEGAGGESPLAEGLRYGAAEDLEMQGSRRISPVAEQGQVEAAGFTAMAPTHLVCIADLSLQMFTNY